MLGGCAAAALTKSTTMPTRTPGSNQHCRGKEDRFIGTSLHECGEVAGCVPCAAVTPTPACHRAYVPLHLSSLMLRQRVSCAYPAVGTTPSCCNRPSVSQLRQASTILPPLK